MENVEARDSIVRQKVSEDEHGKFLMRSYMLDFRHFWPITNALANGKSERQQRSSRRTYLAFGATGEMGNCCLVVGERSTKVGVGGPSYKAVHCVRAPCEVLTVQQM